MATEGDWVRVTKRLRFQDQVHPVVVEGRLVQRRRIPAIGSFAGSPDGRLWMDEIVLRKADGEQSAMIVDAHTRVEVVAETPAAHDAAPASSQDDSAS